MHSDKVTKLVTTVCTILDRIGANKQTGFSKFEIHNIWSVLSWSSHNAKDVGTAHHIKQISWSKSIDGLSPSRLPASTVATHTPMWMQSDQNSSTHRQNERALLLLREHGKQIFRAPIMYSGGMASLAHRSPNLTDILLKRWIPELEHPAFKV